MCLTGCNHFVIEANTLMGNWASFGGGIDLKASEVGQVQNNPVVGNLAQNGTSAIGWGGGIFCEIDGATMPGNIAIINNTIAGNAAPGPLGSDQGGGISLDLVTNNLILANNIVAFNSGGFYQYPSQAPPAIPSARLTLAPRRRHSARKILIACGEVALVRGSVSEGSQWSVSEGSG